MELARGCGMQNTPPGAWETAVHCRVPDCTIQEPERLLYKEKSLLQAWSFRGAPVVFPADESAVFLSSLAPVEGEPWVYTAGIALALDILQMSLEELLAMLVQTMPRLDGEVIVSKSALDQTLAQWMLPLVPTAKRELWNSPSVYGSPDKQTIGGAVVSFLLRPCAFKGLQRKIWTMVTNPGAVVCKGEVVGIWSSRKKSSGIEIKFTLWETPGEQQKLYDMEESYAAFRRQKLLRVEL